MGGPEMADASAEIPWIFDADNHYWETSDAFTRHRDPRFTDRGLQVKEVDGVMRYVLTGRCSRSFPGRPTIIPVRYPGAFMDYFKGETTQRRVRVEDDRGPVGSPRVDRPRRPAQGDGRAGRRGDVDVPVAGRRARAADARAIWRRPSR